MKLHRLLGYTPSKESEPISTGFQELDQITGGLQIGEICTIGGRPGMGKTAFAVSLLRNIGVIQKVPTAYLSLDLREHQIVKRLKASMMIRLDEPSCEQTDWLPPHALVEEMEEFGFRYRPERNPEREALEMMKAAPVWIEHDLCVNMNEIISRMERLHQENQVRVFFIDSLQWIVNSTKLIDQPQEFIKLLQAAERLKVAIVLTCMLSRAVETRGGTKRPMLSDLRDMGLLELYSSQMMFIYRPEYYRIETFEDGSCASHLADIMVLKNRFGHVGNVRLRFENHASFQENKYENLMNDIVKNNIVKKDIADSDMPF